MSDKPQVIEDHSAEGYGYKEGEQKQSKAAKPENKNYGVGGTGEDGGLSTADTVADGGAEKEEEDGEFKPS